MTSRDFRNIHTTSNNSRNAISFLNMPLKLPQYFYLLMEKPLGCSSKLGLLTIRCHSAPRKHLFLYPPGDSSDLRKPRKDNHEH